MGAAIELRRRGLARRPARRARTSTRTARRSREGGVVGRPIESARGGRESTLV